MPESPIEKRERVLEEIAKTDRSAAEDHQWRPDGLTPQQERMLIELEEAAEEVRQWEDISPEDEIESDTQLDDQARYEKALMRAIRGELCGHPIVRAWLAARRSLGDWDELRRLRLRLESGVDKPMSKADFWIVVEAQNFIDRGDGPEAVRRALIKKLKSETPLEWFDLSSEEIERLLDRLDCSRQNFHRWLKRLGII